MVDGVSVSPFLCSLLLLHSPSMRGLPELGCKGLGFSGINYSGEQPEGSRR